MRDCDSLIAVAARGGLCFGTWLMAAFAFFRLVGRTFSVFAAFALGGAQREGERGERGEAESGEYGMCFHAMTLFGVRREDGAGACSAKGDLQNSYIHPVAGEVTRLHLIGPERTTIAIRLK